MGRTIRFSIAGLMAIVLIAAVGLAALRSGSEIWAGVIFLMTCAVLALAIVGMLCRREAERAWWLGFALFGWGYMALAFWPSDQARLPSLPTTALLDWLSTRMGPNAQGVGVRPGMYGPQAGNGVQGGLQSISAAAMAGGFGGSAGPGGGPPFVQVGHCLLALLFAIVGGTLAKALFAIPPRRSEGQHIEGDLASPRTWEGWLCPVVTGLAGVGLIVLLAAIRPHGSPALGAGAIYFFTCGLFGLAVLGSALGEGKPRQIWLGAALFGTGYMILAFGRAGAPYPQPYLPTDQLLFALRSWLPRSAQGLFIPAKTEAANARILKALDEPISMSFANETPLDDILKYIKQATQSPTYNGIPIYVEPIGLIEAEKSLTSTVTIDLEGIPLRNTLHECLKQLGLGYCVTDGFLKISSASRAWPVYQDSFLMSGHCILALIAAAAGGVLAPLVATRRARWSRTSELPSVT